MHVIQIFSKKIKTALVSASRQCGCNPALQYAWKQILTCIESCPGIETVKSPSLTLGDSAGRGDAFTIFDF